MTKEEQIVNLVDEFFKRRKHVLVHNLALAFKDRLRSENSLWISIGSLSSLRTQVGGRFENLKEKWVASGFPLKEHRGEPRKEFLLNTEKWLLLKLWIEKRGFDVLLSSNEEQEFFRVKKKLQE